MYPEWIFSLLAWGRGGERLTTEREFRLLLEERCSLPCSKYEEVYVGGQTALETLFHVKDGM